MAAPGAEWKLRSDRVCPQADNATSPRGLCFSAVVLCLLVPGVLPALSLIPTDEDCFRDRILARLSLNVRAGRIGLCPKMVRREGKQPEVIMMRPMAMRWTRTAIAHFPKIVDRLLHFGVLRGVVRKLRCRRRNIVSRPMMPCAGGRIGIVAEQDKTPRSGWRAGPLQRWREVFSIAGNRRGIAAPSSKALEMSFMALSIRLQETPARA